MEKALLNTRKSNILHYDKYKKNHGYKAWIYLENNKYTNHMK